MKEKLLFIPLTVGLLLLVYSWFLSYPIAIDSAQSSVFSEVNWLYWPGFSLTLASLYLMALTFKTEVSRWLIIVVTIAVIFSLPFFNYLLPGSDTRYFRGLNENFAATNNLDPTNPSHYYYQWPSFFLVSYISSVVSGLSPQFLEFFFYFIIGLIIGTGLYLYASRLFREAGFVIVITFFIAMFSQLNYQFVPFSLSFCFVILVFMMESYEKTARVTAIAMAFALSSTFAHAFVSLFLVLYFLIRYVRERSRHYLVLFLGSLIGYFVVQITIAQLSFFSNLYSVLNLSSEYSNIIAATLNTSVNQIDVYAQIFSRTVTLGLMGLCGIGFLFLFFKKKIRNVDKSILLTGVLYAGAGLVLYTLGSRAIPIAFIPICLGMAYLFQKQKRFIKYIFLVLLVLSVSIPLHQAFGNQEQIQTEADYSADNFVILHNTWTPQHRGSIIAEYRVTTYIQPKLSDIAVFDWDPDHLLNADVVIHTVSYTGSLDLGNSTFVDNFNVLYDNGFSSVHTRLKY